MDGPKIPTPQENLETIFQVCKDRQVDNYTLRAAVLAGYAESNFQSKAEQVGLEDRQVSYGVYQQKLKYWPSANKGTAAQCHAFLDEFGKIQKTGQLVQDIWKVQRWAPSDKFDPSSPETLNYSITHGGEKVAQWIIDNGKLP